MSVESEIFIATTSPPSEMEMSALSSDLAEALGENRLIVFNDKRYIHKERVEDYEVLPDKLPRTPFIFRVRLTTPYYGKGYERGCWHEIAATLEFLRRRIPSAKIWYGPNGTDVLEEVTHTFLEEMWSYWAAYGGRPYYKK